MHKLFCFGLWISHDVLKLLRDYSAGEMTKSECRMTKEIRSLNDEIDQRPGYSFSSGFVIPSSLVIRASSFRSFQIREQGRMCFLIGEGFGALVAFFHNELVQRRIDGQGIVSVETGQAKAIHRSSGRPYHAFHIEVTKAVDTEIFADVFHRHLVRNQLFRIGKVNSVVTSKSVWRTAHAHVHFFGAGFAQIHYARSRGSPAHDRIVYN